MSIDLVGAHGAARAHGWLCRRGACPGGVHYLWAQCIYSSTIGGRVHDVHVSVCVGFCPVLCGASQCGILPTQQQGAMRRLVLRDVPAGCAMCCCGRQRSRTACALLCTLYLDPHAAHVCGGGGALWYACVYICVSVFCAHPPGLCSSPPMYGCG
jgi:hypothetical protein